jgi:alpha-1,6-mannosyltransferase
MKIKLIILIVIYCITCLFLTFGIKRTDFYWLISLYAVFFISFLALVKYLPKDWGLGLGLGVRVLLLFSLPTWSQDFYRFFWDAKVTFSGLSPYGFSPQMLKHLDMNQELLLKMGSLSASNHSNYPALAQYLFLFSYVLSFGKLAGFIVVFKLLLLVFDLLFYYWAKKLLALWSLSPRLTWIYFLNPLLIMECAHNMHFESIMLALFCGAIYFLSQQKKTLFYLFYGLSVLTKLLTIFYLGLLIKKGNWAKHWVWLIALLFMIVLAFGPLFLGLPLAEYIGSVGLWFGKFEFNASFYYLFRALGYKQLHYNINQLYSQIFLGLLFCFFLYQFFRKSSNSFQNSLILFQYFLGFYFLFATTVHPWYILNLVFLSVFTKKFWPLVWSFTAALSYQSYTNLGFEENYWVLLIEYVPVLVCLFLEKIQRKSLSSFV